MGSRDHGITDLRVYGFKGSRFIIFKLKFLFGNATVTNLRLTLHAIVLHQIGPSTVKRELLSTDAFPKCRIRYQIRHH
jgi:hypothetical protein